MVQLWVNLPAKDKGAPAAYQAITADMIPSVSFDGGTARVVAGAFGGTQGPARTFTPINLYAGTEVVLPLTAGHTSMITVLSGQVTTEGEVFGEADIARLSSDGEGVTVRAEGDAMVLVLSGEPIDEPVAAHGPFVMNSEEEILQTIRDFQTGQFGRMAQ